MGAGTPGWTSPTGRHYTAEHPDREPPHWPPGLLPTNETPGFVEAEPPHWLLDDNLEDPHDFPPDHPIWDDFYATPPNLPQEPLKEWKRDLVQF
ncbi:hypothetical protein ARTHRO9AX_90100 [Arthrobacter sp. 9AX]|uniref:hypothetical protein n=1 Tax=Arthrobacter sp. 9AX TaxID=2653131 RepID=UPI0012EFF19E|nr:hypothetical protein [Arthrobacter sp. 9AX]VXC65772.1 hypothetical protein ARTHRO9AX_90100 [Arthrobacter sp. 9AX]